VFTLCAAAAFSFGALLHTTRAAQATLAIVPYTATTQIVNPRTGVVDGYFYEAVRSDGSRLERPSPEDTFIWDMSDMTEVNINHVAKIHLKTPLVRRRLASFVAKSPDCRTHFSGPFPKAPGAPVATCRPTRKTKFGYPVIDVSVQSTVTNGYSSAKKLEVIKELGWLVIHREDIGGDGRAGFVADVIDVRVGEPLAGEFAIPKDYPRVANFMEFARAFRAAHGEPLDPKELEEMRKKWDGVVAEAKAGGDFRFQ